MKRIPLSLFFILAFSSLAFAQTPEDKTNKFEIFTGYSGATLFTGEDFEPWENGFNMSAAYNVRRYIGIKADVSGSYRTLEGEFWSTSSPGTSLGRWKGIHSLYNVAAGVQFKDSKRKTKAKPFAHVLVGYGNHFDKFKTPCPSGAQCPPFNVDFEGVSLIIGGGVDVKINRRIDIRVVQFDFNPVIHNYEGSYVSWSNNRISSGIVFKF